MHKTLDLVNEIRLSTPQKSIWLYTGYLVLVDGKYEETQRDITLQWCGSRNQNVIDVKKTIQKGEIVLWKD